MVGPLGVGGAGSGIVALLATSSWYGGSPVPPPVVPATLDGAVFVPWATEDDAYGSEEVPQCSWWNGSVVYTSDLCSHFSLSRMASNSAGRAIERAVKCAALFETECVISPEIGVSIPAAFVYDPEGSGMRMIIAPRLLPLIRPGRPTNPGMPEETEFDVRHVRIQDPTERTAGRVAALNYSVSIEYLPGGSRAPVSEGLSGSDAYCVQLLRAAFAPECWEQLD